MDVIEQKYTSELDELRTQLLDVLKLDGIGDDETAALALLETHKDWEATLIKYTVLKEATPNGLATFIIDNEEEHKTLVDDLLANTGLCKQMLLADGPQRYPGKYGKGQGFDPFIVKKTGQISPSYYGQAMKIYLDIVNVSDNVSVEIIGKEEDGSDINIFQKLAVAIALEHSIPIQQANPKELVAAGDAAVDEWILVTQSEDEQPNEFVDPIQRYLNYEMAYLNGELDPHFPFLSVFELRSVVDGDEPDEVAAWGRTVLRNYRPDHILMNNTDWRYSEFVRTNIEYGSNRVKYDKDTLQKYQNILVNGGICGRRAFFGRFILRVFGIPTMGHPTKGHGALCRYAPPLNIKNFASNRKGRRGGWTINLGPGWGCGNTIKTYYKKDTDFLKSTQARTYHPIKYWNGVKYAQFIGILKDEKRIYNDSELENDRIDTSGSFWYKLSLKIQQTIIDQVDDDHIPYINKKKNQPDDMPQTLLEKLSRQKVEKETISVEDEDGTIIVPAAACSHIDSKKETLIMKSYYDGNENKSEDDDHKHCNEQLYMVKFSPQGESIFKGGSFKNDENKLRSGSRGKSAGYGRYPNFGFRIAVSIPTADKDDEDDDDDVCLPSEEDGTWTINCGDDDNTTIELVYIKPGTFIMGDSKEDENRFEGVEVPRHEVEISKGYYVGKYPITQKQFEAVTGVNPSKTTKDPNCPVENVHNDDCVGFCLQLSDITKQDVRLPTEAEWEYACRGGTTTTYICGDDPTNITEYAWCKFNSEKTTHPVGLLKPNGFGLYDVIGNVVEHVADRYHAKYYENCAEKGVVVDPQGANAGISSIVEYKLNLPKGSANYTISALVVTANERQVLRVAQKVTTSPEVPEDGEGVVMELPLTMGLWQESKPTVIALEGEAGEEITLRFWRDNAPQFGVAIKKFTIKPV